ncbi:D-glycero-alpha-D-manno-heptose-1,7-bisphosphate 7-phosphatase [Enterococcus sp. LJL99]
MRVAFLDRDGTIIKDYRDEEWRNIQKPDFFDGSIKTLKKVDELGYKIIFISNQYLINQNIITEKQFSQVNRLFLKTLAENKISVLDFFYCPHTDEECCDCKKPKTGMIDKVLEKFPSIDLKRSFYIGDSIVDVELAEQFSLKIFHISSERIRDYPEYQNIDRIEDILEYI